MFVLRLTFFTCLFYTTIGLVIQAGLLLLTYWKGGVAISFGSRSGIAVFASFFGIISRLSFLLAFRIVFANVWARFAG